MQLVAVTPENHAGKHFLPIKNYEFCARNPVVPIVPAELVRLVSLAPVVIRERNGHDDLVALFGVQDGINLAVAPDGRWMPSYVPALIRSHPFTIAKPAELPEQVLCVDESTGLVTDRPDGNAKAFFDADRKPTRELAGILDFMRQLAASGTQSMQACAALRAAGVLKPLKLNLRGSDGKPGEPREIPGLSVVDRKALEALDDATFLKLRANDALAIAHAQIISMTQFATLENLIRLRQTQTRRAAAAAVGSAAQEAVPGLTANDTVLKFT